MSELLRLSKSARRLLAPFAGLVALSVLLQIGALLALLELGADRERNRSALAVVEDQRSLISQYKSATYLALVALSAKNWELLLQQRSEAKEIEARFDQNAMALLFSGKVVVGGAEISLTALEAEPRALLEQAAEPWDELKRAQVRAIRALDQSLDNNPDLEQFKRASSKLETIIGAALQDAKRRTHADAARLGWIQRFVPWTALALLIALGLFVTRRMILPLGASMESLEKSEAALRVARGELEERVAQRTKELSLANEELRQKSELLDSVLRGMGDAVLVAGSDERLLVCNAAASELLGADKQGDAMHGWLARRRCLLPDRTTELSAEEMPLSRALRGEACEQMEMFLEAPDRPDGIWLSVISRPLHGSDQSRCGGVAVFRDITPRKEAEERLRRMNDELERRVKERTRELKEAQAHAVDLARQAGMSEVASNVLHNIGNVLTSLGTSVSMLAERLRASRLETLGKLAAMLRERRNDIASFLTADERGRQLPEYVHKLSGHLLAERDEMLEVTGELNRHVEHIRVIVDLQQSYAKTAVLEEIVSLEEIVEDALRMSAAALERHEIRVERRFAELRPGPVDKHKVLQILLNLIGNAKYALAENKPGDRVVIVQIERPAEDRARIQVIDNGMGISPEALPRIFQHGFTTRKEGHGFGLHSSAIAARVLGGSLSVHSDGRGRGATFTLELRFREGAEGKRERP
jgi:PAS domain S-box-containing protein